ncbi:myristoylated alanine-rich C-kinase substrate-like [Hemicordylus capensis]|uniref:myristoylated alanine-rich C-kinase substrate-like n=1 Tax=Hemicordylus capensis TaxID=884348 RepID=UPI002302DD59|nr:myristoylated alanine-rich C-kinase substrate-like [Hemicordylus capensis]
MEARPRRGERKRGGRSGSGERQLGPEAETGAEDFSLEAPRALGAPAAAMKPAGGGGGGEQEAAAAAAASKPSQPESRTLHLPRKTPQTASSGPTASESQRPREERQDAAAAVAPGSESRFGCQEAEGGS